MRIVAPKFRKVIPENVKNGWYLVTFTNEDSVEVKILRVQGEKVFVLTHNNDFLQISTIESAIRLYDDWKQIKDIEVHVVE